VRGARRAAAWALLPAAALAGGCVSVAGDADRLWRSGDWAAAAAVYERSLATGGDRAAELALLRLGLAYAAPSSPVHDPARARGWLAQLVARYPDGRHREAAEVLLQLVAAFEVAAERAERLQAEQADLAGRMAASESELEVARTSLARVRGELADAEEAVRRLRATLEEVKRIDLSRRSGVTPERPR